jgi:RNA polymerase sigma-70 factor (ECF subfamily)
VGDPGRTEELTQEVFASAAAALPDDDPGEPLAWLYAVAKRRFADDARRRSRERSLLSVLPYRSESEYGPSIARALREALSHLPGGQAQVVVLKLVRGLSFAEIAAELGLTEAAAKMRFMRALKELRADLTERGIEP